MQMNKTDYQSKKMSVKSLYYKILFLLRDGYELIHSTEEETIQANLSSHGMLNILTDLRYTCTQNVSEISLVLGTLCY